MENRRLAREQASDMPTPLRKERAAAKVLCMCLQRGPDSDQHILIGLLNAALQTRRDTSGVLANNIHGTQNGLSQLILFAGDRGEQSDFGNHANSPLLCL